SLSIGIFFSLMVAGLAASLPTTLTNGLRAQGVPDALATQVGGLPPVGSLFAAFLGVNPIAALLGPSGVLHTLPPANVATLTGQQFFPHLIAQPFHDGLVVVFAAATVMMVIGAVASIFDGSSSDAEGHSSPAEGERLGEEPEDADSEGVRV
ncbi:MAG TPA: MFS transporter, partial [Actinomycetes bacterium]